MSHVLSAGSRLGLIAEGLPDLKVAADWLVRLLRPDLLVLPRDRRELAPKPELLRRAPGVAAALLEAGCVHIIILWDSAAFGVAKHTPDEEMARFWQECDMEDLRRAEQGLPKLDRDRLCPVPVIKELESWLLADERALSQYLSTAAHPVSIRRVRHPQREPNPKRTIGRTFEVEGRRRGGYVDYLDAEPLARLVPDIQRLRKLSSFQLLMANVDVSTLDS